MSISGETTPAQLDDQFLAMLGNLTVQDTQPIQLAQPEETHETISYSQMVAEIKQSATVAWKTISHQQTGNNTDGRITSTMKEGPFLEALIQDLNSRHPDWKYEIPKARHWFDISINDLPINLKLTDCASSDNASNKRAFYYSICGALHNYPASSNWNRFWQELTFAKQQQNGKSVKTIRDPRTEYHYLVVNKKTGAILFKPIFDIKNYYPNPSNEFQIKWGDEFAAIDYYCAPTPEAYQQKIQQLLGTLQKSITEMIKNVQQFAIADTTGLFSLPAAAE